MASRSGGKGTWIAIATMVLILTFAGCTSLIQNTQPDDLTITNVQIATGSTSVITAYSQTDYSVPLKIYVTNNGDTSFDVWVNNGGNQELHQLFQRGDSIINTEYRYTSLDSTPDIKICFIRDGNGSTYQTPPSNAVCKIIQAPNIDYTVDTSPDTVAFSFAKNNCTNFSSENSTPIVYSKQVIIKNSGNARLPLSVQVQVQQSSVDNFFTVPYPEFYVPDSYPDIDGEWNSTANGVGPGESIYLDVNWTVDYNECNRLAPGSYEEDGLVYLPTLPNRPPIIQRFKVLTNVSD